MKKFNFIKILTSSTFLIVSILCYAKIGHYTFNDASLNSESLEPYTISLKKLPLRKEITVTFKLNYLDITKKNNIYPHELVHIKGFGLNMEDTRPCLPEKTLLIAIQQSTKCDVEILSCEETEIPCEISPSQSPRTSNSEVNQLDSLPEIAQYEGYNYDSPLFYSDVQTYRGRHIHRLVVTPVSYSRDDKTIKVWTEFTARLKWQDEDKDYLSFSSRFDDYTLDSLDGLEIYFWNTQKKYFLDKISIPYDEDLAIITTMEAYKGLEDFIEWKKTLGYNVHVYTQDIWTDLEIKERCKECYESLYNLTNVILVGDVDNVNSEWLQEHKYICLNFDQGIKPYFSDNRYSCMDGEDDYMPDFFISRIPFSSEPEVRNYCQKVINYEMGNKSAEVYSSHAVCSTFDSSENDKNEELYRFIKLSEDIATYGEGLGNSFERLYSCPADVYPSKFSSNPLFGINDEIPESIKKPTYLWNKGKSDIINTFNKGVSTFTYNYHGGGTRWTFGGFNVLDFPLLDNEAIHPIVFSMACYTGNLSGQGSFASELIRGKTGALGVFASSAISYTVYNDALIYGVYDGIWDTPGLNPWIGLYRPSITHYSQTQRRVSDILHYGFSAMIKKIPAGNFNELNYNNYQRLVYHYFGDATMSVYSRKPDLAPGFLFSNSNDNYVIKLPDGKPRIISIKEITNDKISRYFGNEINISNINDTLLQVCINGKDIAPTISYIRPFEILEQIKNPGISSCLYDKNTRIAHVSLRITNNYNSIELQIIPMTEVSNANPAISISGKQAEIDFSDSPNGIYSIILVVDNKICDSYKLLVD